VYRKNLAFYSGRGQDSFGICFVAPAFLWRLGFSHHHRSAIGRDGAFAIILVWQLPDLDSRFVQIIHATIYLNTF